MSSQQLEERKVMDAKQEFIRKHLLKTDREDARRERWGQLEAVWPEFERLQRDNQLLREHCLELDEEAHTVVKERDELLGILKVIAKDYESVYVGHLAKEAIRKLELPETEKTIIL